MHWRRWPWGVTCQELLETAKLRVHGELNEATIPWLEAIAAADSAREIVLKGYIHISGRKLVVEVNSAQRAKAFRMLISDTPEATARRSRTIEHQTDKEASFSVRPPRSPRHVALTEGAGGASQPSRPVKTFR